MSLTFSETQSHHLQGENHDIYLWARYGIHHMGANIASSILSFLAIITTASASTIYWALTMLGTILTCTNSFNPHNNSIRLLLVFYSFYTGVDRGTIINSLR